MDQIPSAVVNTATSLVGVNKKLGQMLDIMQQQQLSIITLIGMVEKLVLKLEK